MQVPRRLLALCVKFFPPCVEMFRLDFREREKLMERFQKILGAVFVIFDCLDCQGALDDLQIVFDMGFEIADAVTGILSD
jgi:hypothetical protein